MTKVVANYFQLLNRLSFKDTISNIFILLSFAALMATDLTSVSSSVVINLFFVQP